MSLDSNRQRTRQSTNIRPSQAIRPYLVAVTDLSYTPPTRASLELPPHRSAVSVSSVSGTQPAGGLAQLEERRGNDEPRRWSPRQRAPRVWVHHVFTEHASEDALRAGTRLDSCDC